jgi:hypothetical protein
VQLLLLVLVLSTLRPRIARSSAVARVRASAQRVAVALSVTCGRQVRARRLHKHTCAIDVSGACAVEC